ncbi:hypothetical protein BDW22DRAFT_327471 [Trametopsis cervina]|nr:hypothetical protein BDW22DRAFT_327471 [Trametopsis cervina]
MRILADIISILVGPVLVTACLEYILYGIFIAQVLYYWTSYEHDGKLIRLCVVFVAILETCHTAFCIHVLYFYLISHYGDPVNGLERIVWSAGILVVEVTQCLYVYRIWHWDGNNRTVTVTMGVLMTCRMVLGFYAGSSLFTHQTWVSLLGSRNVFVILNIEWSVVVFVDLTLTLVLLFYLLRGHKVALAGTKSTILSFMQLMLSTGVLTLLVSTVILITFNVYSRSLLFGGLISATGELYGNSMLALLNTRRMMAKNAERADEENARAELSQIRWAPAISANVTVTTSNAIHISMERTTASDDMLPNRKDVQRGSRVITIDRSIRPEVSDA